MKKPAKISLYIILLIFLAGAMVDIFAPQWYYVAYTKKFIIHDKILSDETNKTFIYTRVTERNVPETKLPITRYITEKGIKIGVPFKSEPQIKKLSDGSNLYEFEDGKYIAVLSYQTNLLNKAKDSFKYDLLTVFGSKAISSNFEYTKTVFNMSPDDLTFKSSIQETGVIITGLIVKSHCFVVPGPSPIEIIAFHSKKFNGFQYSSGTEVKKANIEIDDLPFIRLAKMTQEEIDTIINSIEIVK